tara:strand:- start:302 stop:1540 length:1239 start_codon:yes stop_codon:yes gene_type:complete
MAETEKTLVEAGKEVMEATAPDAPKKNAVPAEPSPLKNDAEDLGAPVVKPTDSNPDATKKVKEVSGDAQQKSEGAPDPMPKLDSKHPGKAMESKETDKDSEDKEIKEGEMPAGLKKYLDKKDDAKKESKKNDKEKEEGYMKASYKKEESDAEKKDEKVKEEKEDKKEIDVKEHVDALVAGDDSLSEEFKTKAATVFEAAIKSKVKEIAEEMQADYDKKLTEETSKSKDELVEKVDSYLAYVVEEWMKENELALERGIKGEIAEDFISGLKKLFEDHYIDVPDEKYNVLEDQSSKIEELEKKLNESIEKNVELSKENGEHKRQDIIDEASKELADTQKEKFNKLAEEVEYSNEEDFTAKVKTIKESYFGKKESTSEIDDVAAESNAEQPQDLTNAMAAYSAAISKTKDIKLSN